jgi:hypothetical protein
MEENSPIALGPELAILLGQKSNSRTNSSERLAFEDEFAVSNLFTGRNEEPAVSATYAAEPPRRSSFWKRWLARRQRSRETEGRGPILRTPRPVPFPGHAPECTSAKAAYPKAGA